MVGGFMLPIDFTDDKAEQQQYLLYQLKVLDKALVQLHRASVDNPEKFHRLLTMLLSYGKVQDQEFDFELDRLMLLNVIFEDLRDFL